MMKVEMKSLSSPEEQAMSDADIKKVITEGRAKRSRRRLYPEGRWMMLSPTSAA